MIRLGLDIGSNSVGSAWIDTEKREITLGVSVFPAGVEKSETRRGAPKNQKRRQTRSQRRSVRRKAQRRRRLRELLTLHRLLPREPQELQPLFNLNPWHLRREALERQLTPHEFGRVLVHLNQRRGALGIELDDDDTDDGKIKNAIKHLEQELDDRTFGQFMADLHDKRRHRVSGKQDKYYYGAVRNRRGKFEFHADRAVIRKEFKTLWQKQESFDGKLAKLLTNDLKCDLDLSAEDRTWRHKGEIFGQRRTYWNTGTLGRCDLEPSAQRCPKRDMYAQEFLMLETVNRIKVEWRDQEPRVLNPDERAQVIEALSSQKTASVATLRRALGLNKKQVKEFVTLNVEREKKAELNTDWFEREIVRGVFGLERWGRMTQRQRESVNRAIQKFDEPDTLWQGAMAWWSLSETDAGKLVEAWKTRPSKQKRVNLSRRAIQNLLPFMREGDDVTTAKQKYGYPLKPPVLTKRDRHFIEKHPDSLPPAPMLANPVVRKSIHEVRRHVNELLRRFGRTPDRVVIELARSARETERVRNAQLAANRAREAERKRIVKDFKLENLTKNQQAKAVLRVRLCIEQKMVCAYSGRSITPRTAANGQSDGGDRIEVDHIVPQSVTDEKGFNNLVLCYAGTNRNKGNRTPKDWLSAKEFQCVEQRFEHLSGKQRTTIGEYEIRPNPRKWENLHRETPDLEKFAESQLADTGYAARQVAGYLREALFDGERDGIRRVFTTKGKYTAMLRRDWGLVENTLDRKWHAPDQPSNQTPPADPRAHDDYGEPGTARKSEKDRTDHRHHAIDAVVIALSTPNTVKQAAVSVQWQLEERQRTGCMPKRRRIDPPWGSQEEFRRQLLGVVEDQIVSYRPVKRKIVGALHEETPYGRAGEYPGLYSFRISARNLKPSNLRPPKKTVSKTGRITWSIKGSGQGSVVRDAALREAIRDCLERHAKDPDKFTERDIKELSDPEDYKLRQRSGVPIRTVRMVRTLSDPIPIVGRDGVGRFYVGGNNHHVEILEDPTGNWTGEVIPTFDAAQRVRRDKKSAVDRSERDGKRFVMSLAEGEIIYSRRRDRPDAADALDYFVICKLDKKPDRIHFAPHWDARKASEQDRWSVTPSDLRQCGSESGKPPYKVSVSPLGEVQPLERD